MSLFLFSLTANIPEMNVNSQIVDSLFVLKICSSLGDRLDSSPVPTIATREVEKSISQIPIAPGSFIYQRPTVPLE